jgi:hypothetical protein
MGNYVRMHHKDDYSDVASVSRDYSRDYSALLPEEVPSFVCIHEDCTDYAQPALLWATNSRAHAGHSSKGGALGVWGTTTTTSTMDRFETNCFVAATGGDSMSPDQHKCRVLRDPSIVKQLSYSINSLSSHAGHGSAEVVAPVVQSGHFRTTIFDLPGSHCVEGT